ncbi:MAG TPA: hypothetical protein VG267_05040 [Terracidiphilus sp.]|jgi:hypothetical protein|nr:hypothetical protein [Terracidiphilus sp.]
MTRSESTLPAPKDRRGIVQAKDKYRIEETEPPRSTKSPMVDKDEEPVERRATFLEVCWPTVFGIVLAILAVRLRAKVFDEWGDVGDRLVFPFVQLASRPELGLGDAGGGMASLMLRLQFPLTGLYASWSLRRNQRMSTTILQILFTYGIAAFVLWLLTAPGATHGM